MKRATNRTRKSRGRAALAVLPLLLALSPLPAGSSAGAVESEPPAQSVAGTTIVYGEGHTGIVLNVPTETTLPRENASVELLEGATYAWVGLADPAPDSCGRDIDPLFGMCLTHKMYMTRMPSSSVQLWSSPPRVSQGIQELYILSDGPVRVSLSFTGLPGTTELHARGVIDAISEPLKADCPTAPDCSNLGWGGVTHVAKHPGWVGVYARAWTPTNRVIADVPYPATRAATSCLYPSYGSTGASTNPEDHPHGCSFLPTEEGDWLQHLTWFVGNTAVPTGGASYAVTENIHPDGPVYAGFTAQQRGTEAPGGYGAYGFWLEEGIEEPGS